MTSDQEFDAVEEFVRARTGVGTRRQITAATRLEDDLDLSGVEAEAFMAKFFDRFKVEVGDFSFDRYFVNEGSGLILAIVTRFSRKKRDALHRVPITVGMLAEAAAAGRWDSHTLET